MIHTKDDLANLRRDGYDWEGFADDGTVRHEPLVDFFTYPHADHLRLRFSALGGQF